MKDYKKTPPLKAQRKSRGGTLLGVFIGLALGLLIAVGIAFYISKMPIPFMERAHQPAPAPDQKLADKAKAPDEPKGDKPKLDFYRILPGQEVPVTEKEVKQEIKQQAAKPDAPKQDYVVQAGAFSSPAEADSLKARLALMGLEASVEPAHIPDKGTVYRVRLGPYSELNDINKVRHTLAENGVDASLVKLKN